MKKITDDTWIAIIVSGYWLGWLVDISYWIATEGPGAFVLGAIMSLLWPIHGTVVLWQWVLA